MLRYSLIISIACFLHFNLKAQNLVPNPSFELYTGPSVYPYIAPNWFSFRSCDHLHPAKGPSYTPPSTNYGTAAPIDGSAYMGAILYMDWMTNYREVMSARLTDSLVKDSTYCISFHYINSDHYAHLDIQYGIDNIGAIVSEDTLLYNNIFLSSPTIRTQPGVYNFNYEWKLCSGFFKSNGNEKFISIGTFGNVGQNDFIHELNVTDYQYYFIDMVRLYQCKSDSANKPQIGDLPNVITPNGDYRNDFYTFYFKGLESLTVSIYNRWGNLVNQIDGIHSYWVGDSFSGEMVSDGVYYVVVQGKDSNGTTISKKQMVHVLR